MLQGIIKSVQLREIYKYVNISKKFNSWFVNGIMNTSVLLQVNVKPFGLHLLCKRREVCMEDQKSIFFLKLNL